MIINDKRALAYTVQIDNIEPIVSADNIEMATVGGWKVIVKKGEFVPKEIAVFFEIDSKLPEEERYAFMARKHYKVKTMKLGKFGVVSQGLLMPIDEFPELGIPDKTDGGVIDVGIDLTDTLHITYAEAEDNKRKAAPNPNIKYQSMAARHQKIFRQKWARWLMRREWGRKVMFLIFGRKKDNPKEWPVGKFPGVSKTDQERCENMPWVLEDKTPWIRTQKCDGTSATYILHRKKHNKYEFFVCSRNVRMADEKQECFYGSDNYYWEMAFEYDIEKKMKHYLEHNPNLTFVCWQGEICGPNIQKNPQNLSKHHLFLFHWTDDEGRKDIWKAERIWYDYDMEVVPIESEPYIMPDDFEEFKLSADGYYDGSCCEGQQNCPREGYVYYSIDNPARSFKNVSRTYLLNHNG